MAKPKAPPGTIPVDVNEVREMYDHLPPRKRQAVMDWCDRNEMKQTGLYGPNGQPIVKSEKSGYALRRVPDQESRPQIVLP